MYDLKVDDRDFKTYPNFYEFCMDPKGLNTPFWSRQFYLCLTLLNEICPICSKAKDVWAIDKKMDPHDLPKYVSIMRHGRCPKCAKSKLDLYKLKRMHAYNELAGLAGQRVGKSLQIAGMCCYLTHKNVKLQNPAKIYSTLQTTFMGTFVGLTFDKAVSQLWLPFSGMMQKSEWFTEYHKMLNQLGKEHGVTYLKFGQTLHYLHRDILIHPSGPDRRTLRGNTRIFGAIDEWDFFNTEDEGKDQVKMNGIEVYKSLSNALLTVRMGWRDAVKRGLVDVPNAYQLNVSSPNHMRGVLTQVVVNNKNSTRIFTFHMPTWEIHPKISEKDIQREYGDDPDKAARDFGAIPPASENAFLDEASAMGMFGNKKNWVRIRYMHRKSPSGGIRRAARITYQAQPSNLPPAVLGIDAGFSNNSFALSMGTFQVTTSGRKLYFPVLIEIAPEKGKSTLDYTKIYELVIQPLIAAYNVQYVVADRWNSIKLLHDIEDSFYIPTEIKSIRYNEFITVRSYIQDGMIEMPARETDLPMQQILNVDTATYPHMFMDRPSDHLLLQACTVMDAGRDVVKGAKLTDDLWRATCVAAALLLDEDWCKKNLHEAKKGGNKGLIAMSGTTGVYGGDGRTMSLTPGNVNVSSVGSIGSLSNIHVDPMSLYNAFRR